MWFLRMAVLCLRLSQQARVLEKMPGFSRVQDLQVLGNKLNERNAQIIKDWMVALVS